MKKDLCHLCQGELFAEPILCLAGMPKAAQYYPRQDEFSRDKGIDLPIVQCSACGLVQLNVPPVEYFREVITAATLSEKSRASRLNQMKELVKKFSLQGKPALEIGSGKGEMLEVMQEAGMLATGVEGSPESVRVGQAAGRGLVQGYIGDDRPIEGGPFAAFVFLNYLEHLPEPGRIIRRIYEQTTADAVGFVTVPNIEYLLRTNSFYEFVADHLSYFSVKTLTNAFELNGFEVLECWPINEDNDLAATVRKKQRLNISDKYREVESLIKELQRILADYRSQGKKVAVWGAGHRTLALLALSHADSIEYIVDSAKFKHGKYAPVTHLKIVAPETLKENKVDLVIVMVPGLYPAEVCKTLDAMGLGIEKAILKDNKVEFVR